MDRRILGLKIKDSDQQFQLLGSIGGGGYGEIYEAFEKDEDHNLIKNHKVAVKQQSGNTKTDQRNNQSLTLPSKYPLCKRCLSH
ncbi:UNKNOWN [Stylonychia lemnae]|uniref:Protein kinase domain-containing protein n=1 Tax=Stylonychia lemnae TaxID=5949 RepID=A0A078A5U0_STYLE|nr:UNKNOWN [Stylonychia lemnae]|eukprot:CDW76915.1 UNKNOWN [Stylonychia lemnae]